MELISLSILATELISKFVGMLFLLAIPTGIVSLVMIFSADAEKNPSHKKYALITLALCIIIGIAYPIVCISVFIERSQNLPPKPSMSQNGATTLVVGETYDVGDLATYSNATRDDLEIDCIRCRSNGYAQIEISEDKKEMTIIQGEGNITVSVWCDASAGRQYFLIEAQVVSDSDESSSQEDTSYLEETNSVEETTPN